LFIFASVFLADIGYGNYMHIHSHEKAQDLAIYYCMKL